MGLILTIAMAITLVTAAVLLMLLATALFAGMGAFVKILREDGFSTLEVMVFRAAPGVPWLWWELRRRGVRLWPHAPGVIFLRVLFGGTAMWASQRRALPRGPRGRTST